MEKLLNYMASHSQRLEALTVKINNFEDCLRCGSEDSPNPQPRSYVTHRNRSAGSAEAEQSITEEIATWLRNPELDYHRTAPHKLLLLWPSILPLLRAAGVEHDDGYVLEAEDRGVLRLWSRGEGIDENDGTQSGGAASSARSDDSSEAGYAGTPRANRLWGVGFPSISNSDGSQWSEPYRTGGLKANNEINLGVNTINHLYCSYMRNIHVMHPFLDKRRLRKMFDNFIERYSTGRSQTASSLEDGHSERPPKKQRSNGSTANGGSGFSRKVGQEQTERSPCNAIIYLVLALGEICMRRDHFPSIWPESDAAARSVVSQKISTATFPVSTATNPSSMSPKSMPTTRPIPLSEANLRYNEAKSRLSSGDGSPSAYNRLGNLDVVPGIAYYAKATEILGDQGDGNDLVHAQMFLLAGIYKAQLARVKESMSWITMAGRVILILLDRYELYNDNYWEASGVVQSQYIRSQSRIKDTRQSLIVLASWTCLQLESDILAELRLPASGIHTVEHLLLLPHKINDNESNQGLEPEGRRENDNNILIYFSAQLFLRRRLNQVHREIYGKDSLSQSLSGVQEMLKSHDSILIEWKRGLPNFIKWEDDDPLTSNILAARLRATYWGARYIVNRPFLDYALHIWPYVRHGRETVESVAKDGYGNLRDKADIHLFRAIRQLDDREVWAAAQRCIHAAMCSTVAFDGVSDRLIVTNIHGIAHAQFGNMLVLSAVYNNAHTKSFLNPHRFQDLLERTIKFLRRLAPISPTCAADCSILEKIECAFFSVNRDLKVSYRNEDMEPMSTSN